MAAIQNARMRVRVEPEMKTPWWFKILLIIASLGSLTIGGLMIWAIVEVIPPLVGWLERH